jgi:hypothetical protein
MSPRSNLNFWFAFVHWMAWAYYRRRENFPTVVLLPCKRDDIYTVRFQRPNHSYSYPVRVCPLFWVLVIHTRCTDLTRAPLFPPQTNTLAQREAVRARAPAARRRGHVGRRRAASRLPGDKGATSRPLRAPRASSAHMACWGDGRRRRRARSGSHVRSLARGPAAGVASSRAAHVWRREVAADAAKRTGRRQEQHEATSARCVRCSVYFLPNCGRRVDRNVEAVQSGMIS